MSDDVVGRYGRLYARIWRHPGFRKLTQAEQRLTLYLLTGPQKNRIGLFYFVMSTAAEDLATGLDTLRKGLVNVCVTFGWCFDADARVFYIPSWWRFNRPENENVWKGNLKDVNEIPECALLDAFAANLTYVPANVQGTFTETLRERLTKRPPIQDQDQEQEQEQEQDPALSRGSAGAGAPNIFKAKHGRAEKLKAAACEVVRETPKADTAYQIDVVLQKVKGAGFTKDDAERALHEARLERTA
jgi:hypothetical protein